MAWTSTKSDQFLRWSHEQSLSPAPSQDWSVCVDAMQICIFACWFCNAPAQILINCVIKIIDMFVDQIACLLEVRGKIKDNVFTNL